MPAFDEEVPDDFYTSDAYQQLNADNPAADITDEGPTDADILPYIEAANTSGADSSVVQTLKNAWSSGGKALDSVSAWAKANPALASMITSGVGNAQKQKYDAEQMDKKNQMTIDAENRAKATAKELYDRRNQSIVDTKTANLGIIGGGMLDGHLAYLKGRK